MALTVDMTIYPFVDLTAQAQVRSGKLTGPASYPTGGVVVDIPNELKMSEVWFFICTPPTNGTVVIEAVYDFAADKLKFFDMAGAEIANTTDLSLYTARFFCTGK